MQEDYDADRRRYEELIFNPKVDEVLPGAVITDRIPLERSFHYLVHPLAGVLQFSPQGRPERTQDPLFVENPIAYLERFRTAFESFELELTDLERRQIYDMLQMPNNGSGTEGHVAHIVHEYMSYLPQKRFSHLLTEHERIAAERGKRQARPLDQLEQEYEDFRRTIETGNGNETALAPVEVSEEPGDPLTWRALFTDVLRKIAGLDGKKKKN